ncbi:DNA-binding transcriptional activator of the SARP family [Saccharopolyspora antimicrobica]|uniref:DNA-binding SARP family transcriptional activator n=1 Tax=Saccharopolyspora antimicrobica TaxID=455193 RepID=A0A1I5AZD4_9PSEU|nr:LysM peptidoglycan-binding domain-containing protein [Saccharopolyspora antimicrobica]RKT86411.1 DNA-binding SARP family transcriptional activator [Saccharopolyspora antimicrobica]SFN67579.1 DNA-binding transcriptional activator of the SARP family [Saccharopolyspora antimicrobica]
MTRGRLIAAGLGVLAMLVGLPVILTVTGAFIRLPNLSWPDLDTSPWAPIPVGEQLLVWAEHTWHTLRIELRLDGALILAVHAAGWATWAVMLWWVLCDLVLLLRHGARALRDRLTVTGPRGWITALLASGVLALNTPTSSATPAAAPVAVTAPLHPTAGPGALPAPGSGTTPLGSGGYPDPTPPEPSTPTHIPDTLRPEHPRYRVVRGDTLWDIAARHLTSGHRWRDIQNLNTDRLGTPRHLHPGWILLLPTDATNLPEPAVIPDDAHWITTQPGDTLTSLAQHHLGDSTRWEEIYALNAHHPQPDGRALRDPDMVFPDWHLALPSAGDPHREGIVQPEPAAVAAPEPRYEEVPEPASSASSERAVSVTSGGAVIVSGAGFVAAGLAAAVALSMRIRRRRRMRVYEPGSGVRANPAPLAPAVYALRSLEDEAPMLASQTNSDDTQDTPPAVSSAEHRQARLVEVGVRDGHARALDLAAVHGLGLIGPGAEATARALLVHVLALTNADVIIDASTARTLISDELPDSPRLCLADDLRDTITDLASQTDDVDGRHARRQLSYVLIAGADRWNPQLQELIDHQATNGIAAILLGNRPTGATVRVMSDGLVATASPRISELRGARLFHLEASDTLDLLDLLADTTSTPGDNEPALNSNEHDIEADFGDSRDAAVADQPPPSVASEIDPGDGAAVSRQSVDVASSQERPVCRPATLTILGPFTLTWDSAEGEECDLTSVLAPKHKALLVFLALHTTGTSRSAVREALWPSARGRRPFNSFYATLSQIRRAIAEAVGDPVLELISQHGEKVALNPDLVDVDYWQLRQAEHKRNVASSNEQRMEAWRSIVAAYHGEVAEGMSALWLDGPREDAHRTALDALACLAAHYRGHDPHQQLQILEHARRLNPENEAIYRDIMRVQAELGMSDAISRTVQLLTTALADIGERPARSTLTLARALQEHHHANSATTQPS